MSPMSERKKRYQREYRARDRERLKEKQHTYYLDNKEQFRRRAREYYQRHKDKIKADAVRTGKVLRRKQRMAVLWYYSGGAMTCVRCGFPDIRALVLDHINGGGTEHRRTMKAGTNVWLWLARHGFPPGYQILCANCNAIKAREENEYGSNSFIGDDWRSRFDWKRQLEELGLHKRGRAWSLPTGMLNSEAESG